MWLRPSPAANSSVAPRRPRSVRGLILGQITSPGPLSLVIYKVPSADLDSPLFSTGKKRSIRSACDQKKPIKFSFLCRAQKKSTAAISTSNVCMTNENGTHKHSVSITYSMSPQSKEDLTLCKIRRLSPSLSSGINRNLCPGQMWRKKYNSESKVHRKQLRAGGTQFWQVS